MSGRSRITQSLTAGRSASRISSLFMRRPMRADSSPPMSSNVLSPPERHCANTSGATSSTSRSVSGADTASNSSGMRASTSSSMSSDRMSDSTASLKPFVCWSMRSA